MQTRTAFLLLHTLGSLLLAESALAEMRLTVRGGASNKGFLLHLLRRPEVQSGSAENAWLDRLTSLGEHLPEPNGAAALVQGAIDATEDGFARERAQFLATATVLVGLPRKSRSRNNPPRGRLVLRSHRRSRSSCWRS